METMPGSHMEPARTERFLVTGLLESRPGFVDEGDEDPVGLIYKMMTAAHFWGMGFLGSRCLNLIPDQSCRASLGPVTRCSKVRRRAFWLVSLAAGLK